jgi:hypothetical protein
MYQIYASERVKKRTLRDSSEVVVWMRCVSWQKVANQKSSRIGGLWIFSCDVMYGNMSGWVAHKVIMTEVRQISTIQATHCHTFANRLEGFLCASQKRTVCLRTHSWIFVQALCLLKQTFSFIQISQCWCRSLDNWRSFVFRALCGAVAKANVSPIHSIISFCNSRN